MCARRELPPKHDVHRTTFRNPWKTTWNTTNTELSIRPLLPNFARGRFSDKSISLPSKFSLSIDPIFSSRSASLWSCLNLDNCTFRPLIGANYMRKCHGFRYVWMCFFFFCCFFFCFFLFLFLSFFFVFDAIYQLLLSLFTSFKDPQLSAPRSRNCTSSLGMSFINWLMASWHVRVVSNYALVPEVVAALLVACLLGQLQLWSLCLGVSVVLGVLVFFLAGLTFKQEVSLFFFSLRQVLGATLFTFLFSHPSKTAAFFFGHHKLLLKAAS